MPRTRTASGTKQPLATPALGEWIRSVRMGQNVSQRVLAERAGVSRSYLCDIERGRGSQPSVTTLDKLAVALGASRNDVLRAAGVLEPVTDTAEQEGERRLLALYRDLSADGRLAVEHFARFMHHEEHRWVQPQLLDMATEDEQATERGPHQSGPTLFDQVLEVAPARPRSRGPRDHRITLQELSAGD